MDFEIVGHKEENREKIQMVLVQMKGLFKEQQTNLDELRSCIAQMKNNHTANKTKDLKNKIESRLKKIESRVILSHNL